MADNTNANGNSTGDEQPPCLGTKVISFENKDSEKKEEAVLTIFHVKKGNNEESLRISVTTAPGKAVFRGSIALKDVKMDFLEEQAQDKKAITLASYLLDETLEKRVKPIGYSLRNDKFKISIKCDFQMNEANTKIKLAWVGELTPTETPVVVHMDAETTPPTETPTIVENDTDLTSLQGPNGIYTGLVNHCFQDNVVGNITWMDASNYTMPQFLNAFAKPPPIEAKLQSWINYYDLENRFKQEQSAASDKIASFSYRRLLVECSKAGLSTAGKTEVLRKRFHEHLQNQKVEAMPPAAKRQKKNEDGVPSKHLKKNEDDLICPINLNLPLDPVIAEDGRVYERSAIEQYIKSNHGGELKSPISREKIGKKLFPAPWVKNTIENMIENGAITGDPAEDWTKRVQQQKYMEDLMKEAEEGDVNAMLRVARHYGYTKKNDVMAYKWADKARLAGSISGMSWVGNCLVSGVGVVKNVAKGMMYLGMAEGRGSDFAAFILGKHLAEGMRHIPADKTEARRLLEKSLSGECSHQCMSDACKSMAQEILDLMLAEGA